MKEVSSMKKSHYVNSDVHLHMCATYKRQYKPKRSFSLVIKGIMLSSAMLGILTTTGVAAAATSLPDLAANPPTIHEVQQLQEDQLVVNLRVAIKTIEEFGWSLETKQAMLDSLQKIESQFSEGSYFGTTGLYDALLDAKYVYAKYGQDGLTALLGEGNSINETIQRIETKMGKITSPNNVHSSQVRKKSDVQIASLTKDEVTIVVNGQTQYFPQPAVIKDGRILVPLRGIFETLGAKVTWNEVTQTATGVKDKNKVIVQLGNKVAYVNDKEVELDVPAQTINGSIMVPLRFVSESFGASINWDSSTKTVYIDGTNTQIVNGIKVRFGKHTYGSRNQEEYDTVVRIVEEALKGYDQSNFGGVYKEYFYEYLNGARWSGDKKDRSDRNRGLFAAENMLGDLVKAGVSKEEIIKVSTLASIAYDLLKGAIDPADGSPNSAYDALVGNASGKRYSDCDSDAQVFSLVFDMMGYNTMIAAGQNHAQMYVEINGKWYAIISGVFVHAGTNDDFSNYLKENPDRYIYTQPTYGPAIL